MTGIEAHSRQRWVTVAFWIVGTVAGAVLAYTTRFYLNGDGINYIEIGEAFRYGNWAGLVNLTESPGYPVLLGIGQTVMNTSPHNELVWLKIVNVVMLLVAMGACHFLVATVENDLHSQDRKGLQPLPNPLFRALCFAAFLFFALAWVRVRVIAPDMMVFALMLVLMSLVLRVKRNPHSYGIFVLLGLVLGIAYLFKSFFFLFSVIILALAGWCVGSFKRAVPRIVVSAVVMLAVASPLIISLSKEVGHFSYSEIGTFGYVNKLAGKGEPIHKPEILNAKPLVLLYDDGSNATYPRGHDLAYWTLGMKPDFDLGRQVKMILNNAVKTLMFAPWLIVGVIIWLLYQWRIGGLLPVRLLPPSVFVLFFTAVLPGVGMYCILHVEPRYLASFFFLAFVAFMTVPGYDLTRKSTVSKMRISSALLVVLLIGLVGESMVDQSLRGLRSGKGKISHRQAYTEQVAVKEFLRAKGLKPGSAVALMGIPAPPFYWGRMANLKILGVIPNAKEFLASTPQQRRLATQAVKNNRMKAVVAKGHGFLTLAKEGWQPIPGTRDYAVAMLNPH